jgi:hypothetical protein
MIKMEVVQGYEFCSVSQIRLFQREWRKLCESREYFWLFRGIRFIREIRVENHDFSSTTNGVLCLA